MATFLVEVASAVRAPSQPVTGTGPAVRWAPPLLRPTHCRHGHEARQVSRDSCSQPRVGR